MLTDERRALILERLNTHGRVLAADLTAELDVSSDTIRRDLRELDGLGLLRRVHGGALPPHGDAAPLGARAPRAPGAEEPPRASPPPGWAMTSEGASSPRPRRSPSRWPIIPASTSPSSAAPC